MITSRRSSLVCLAAFLAGATALAAQRVVEGFTGGANGWAGTTGSTPFGETGEWTFTGGVARVQFFDPGFPVPDSGTLSNTPAASSGSFTGNYDQAGINRIGFSIYASQVVPANGFAILEWAGSTSLYQKGFTVAATGVWYQFSASLADEAKGTWTVLAGSPDDFAAARQSVKYVSIRVNRNGSPDQVFLVDDIFLGGNPGAAALAPAGNSVFHSRWGGLLTSRAYSVESAPEVTGVWSVAQSFTATSHVQGVAVTNAGPRGFWRVIGP